MQETGISSCCGLNCDAQRDMLTHPVPVNVTLFGSGVIADVTSEDEV